MKKLYLSVMCVICWTWAAAQSTAAQSYVYQSNSFVMENYGNMDFSYQALENACELGITANFNHLTLSFSTIAGEANAYVKKNEGWRAGIGGNYLFFKLADALFADICTGVEYNHAAIEYKAGSSWEKVTDGNLGLFSPHELVLNYFV